MKKILSWIALLSIPFSMPGAEAIPNVTENLALAQNQTFSQVRFIEEQCPVLILGSGVAAMTAATYLARGGISPIVITGPALGGMITQSHDVQNWPGEISISGTNLSDQMKIQAEGVGADFRLETAVSANFSQRPFAITTQRLFGDKAQKSYKTDAVIIAMGAVPKFLGVPGEQDKEGYWLRGVYNCAVCDGALYKDKVVAVVGGGDSALIETQYLANLAKKVYVFVRGTEFRTVEKERMKRIVSLPNVQVHYNTVIREVKGDGQKMTALSVSPTSSQALTEVPADALFLAIGSKPNTELFRDQLELDAQGYIVLKGYQKTSIDGVYAAGDVCDPQFKQAVTAAGDGAKAALQVEKDLLSYQSLVKTTALSQKNSPSVLEVTSLKQLDQEVKDFDGFVFIDFYSTHCGPCRMFSPLYDTWAKEYGGKIKFLKVNADNAAEIFETYQIRVVPTLIILDNKGRIVRKSSGFGEISEVDKRLERMKGKDDFSILY